MKRGATQPLNNPIVLPGGQSAKASTAYLYNKDRNALGGLSIGLNLTSCETGKFTLYPVKKEFRTAVERTTGPMNFPRIAPKPMALSQYTQSGLSGVLGAQHLQAQTGGLQQWATEQNSQKGLAGMTYGTKSAAAGSTRRFQQSMLGATLQEGSINMSAKLGEFPFKPGQPMEDRVKQLALFNQPYKLDISKVELELEGFVSRGGFYAQAAPARPGEYNAAGVQTRPPSFYPAVASPTAKFIGAPTSDLVVYIAPGPIIGEVGEAMIDPKTSDTLTRQVLLNLNSALWSPLQVKAVSNSGTLSENANRLLDTPQSQVAAEFVPGVDADDFYEAIKCYAIFARRYKATGRQMSSKDQQTRMLAVDYTTAKADQFFHKGSHVLSLMTFGVAVFPHGSDQTLTCVNEMDANTIDGFTNVQGADGDETGIGDFTMTPADALRRRTALWDFPSALSHLNIVFDTISSIIEVDGGDIGRRAHVYDIVHKGNTFTAVADYPGVQEGVIPVIGVDTAEFFMTFSATVPTTEELSGWTQQNLSGFVRYVIITCRDRLTMPQLSGKRRSSGRHPAPLLDVIPLG